jgi:hypothetical protein
MSEVSRDAPTSGLSSDTTITYSSRKTPAAVPKTDLVDDLMSLHVVAVHGCGPLAPVV